MQPQTARKLIASRKNLPSPDRRDAIRTESGVSRAAVAAALGVTRETVRKWEAGETEPSDRFVIDYAKLLVELARHDGELA